MPIKEVFTNPTVKQVVFQIRFPNLFYIEDKIGDFQVRIMDLFPESSLSFRRQVLLADMPPDSDPQVDLIKFKQTETQGNKIWQFKNKDIALNVMSSSLDLSSSKHKTYNNPNSTLRFRDIISRVLDNFFEVVNIPILQRMGLRYIDEISSPDLTLDTYLNFINSRINSKNLDLRNIQSFDMVTTLKKGENFLNFAERIVSSGETIKSILDFDAFAQDIPVRSYLERLDELHEIIIDDYTSIIKKPVYEMMRKK